MIYDDMVTIGNDILHILKLEFIDLRSPYHRTNAIMSSDKSSGLL